MNTDGYDLAIAVVALLALVTVLWPWWSRKPPPERMSDQWRNRARRDEAGR